MSDDDTYPNAGRPSGYTDDGKAVGEDLVNKVTILVAGIQTSLVGIRSDIGAVAQRQAAAEQQHRQDETVNQTRASRLYRDMGAFLKDADVRFNRYDSIFATVEEVVRGLKKFSDDIDLLKRGQTESNKLLLESQADRADLRQRIDMLQERLDSYIAGSKRAEVELLRQEIAALKRAHGLGDDG